MAHANSQRMTVEGPAAQRESIKISEFWEEQLKKMPYLSQKPGKTLHLLKLKSKPGTAIRKRRKIQVLGTLAQYKEQHAKASKKIPSLRNPPEEVPPSLAV